MKRLILIIGIVLSPLPLFTQVSEHKLHLVAGFPDNNFVPETSDLINVSALLKIEKDSLIEEMLLSDSLQKLDYIRCYPEYNALVALAKRKINLYEVVPSLGYQIIIIDLRTLKKEVVSIPDSVMINEIRYTFFADGLSSIMANDNLSFILKYVNFDVKEDKSNTGILYYLFDPITQKLKKTYPSILRDAIANSGNLVLANNYEGEILKGDTTTNNLKIATTRFYENPVYCDYLPKDVKINRKSYAYAAATVLINNNKALALYLYEREQQGKWVFCKVHVFNKEQKAWNVFDLETSWVIAKYYENYIAGNFRVKQLESNEDQYPFESKYWNKEKTKYGPSYKYFFLEYPIWRYYSEGDLYLYNINSKNIIKWNTGHGDSEILLVQNEIVYYRVNNKIYKARIIDKKILAHPDLIVQDTRVTDIHWAFLSEK